MKGKVNSSYSMRARYFSILRDAKIYNQYHSEALVRFLPQNEYINCKLLTKIGKLNVKVE